MNNSSNGRFDTIRNKEKLLTKIDDKYNLLVSKLDGITTGTAESNNDIKTGMKLLLDFLEDVVIYIEACVPVNYKNKRTNKKTYKNKNKLKYDTLTKISNSINEMKVLIQKYTRKEQNFSFSSAFSPIEGYNDYKVKNMLNILFGTFGIKKISNGQNSITPIKKIALNRAINVISDKKITKKNSPNDLKLSNYTNKIKTNHINSSKGNELKRIHVIYKIIKRLLTNENLQPFMTPQQIKNEKNKREQLEKEQKELNKKHKTISNFYNEINKKIEIGLRSVANFEAENPPQPGPLAGSPGGP